VRHNAVLAGVYIMMHRRYDMMHEDNADNS
jgi:hypothetical protein